MKRQQGALLFLKGVVIMLGVAALAVALFGLPEIARKDAAAHPDTTYISYLFLLYAYMLCVPFLIALYQVYLLFTNISRNQTFSASSIKALVKIKHCALSIVLLLVAGIVTSLIVFYGKEDMTAIVMLALISILATSIVAAFATVLQRLFQQTIDNQFIV
ncbi:DUF2975 domain-containing protein [Lysinibacillus sp. NPDC098008]